MFKKCVAFVIVINFLCLTYAHPYFEREEAEQRKQSVLDKIWNINCISKKAHALHESKYANSIPTNNKYDIKKYYHRKQTNLLTSANSKKHRQVDIGSTHATELLVAVNTSNKYFVLEPLSNNSKGYLGTNVNDSRPTIDEYIEQANKKPLKRGVSYDDGINNTHNSNMDIKEKSDNNHVKKNIENKTKRGTIQKTNKPRNKFYMKSSPNITTHDLVKSILEKYVDKPKIDMPRFYGKYKVFKLRFNSLIAKTHKYDDENVGNNVLETKSKSTVAIYKQRGKTKTSEENYPEDQVAKRTLEDQKNGKSGESMEGRENGKSDDTGGTDWFHRVTNGVKALGKNLNDGITSYFSSRSDADKEKTDDSGWNISSILNFMWTILMRAVEQIRRACVWIYETTCQYWEDIKKWKPCFKTTD
ncbi:hypothetical protein WDU94_001416 [Cyamophila willieti]